jgi:hypothetical protein
MIRMSKFIDLLRDEIARLENQLTHARALLRSYEDLPLVRQERRPGVNGGSARVGQPFQPKGANSKEQKIRTAIVEFLGPRSSAHRTEILEKVESLGLMGHEKDPLKALGVYLNHFKDVIAPEGKGRWRLRVEHERFVAGSEEPADEIGA